jgi:hypothetical protein
MLGHIRRFLGLSVVRPICEHACMTTKLGLNVCPDCGVRVLVGLDCAKGPDPAAALPARFHGPASSVRMRWGDGPWEEAPFYDGVVHLGPGALVPVQAGHEQNIEAGYVLAGIRKADEKGEGR